MLISGHQIADQVRQGRTAMIDYLSDRLKGRTFDRSPGNLMDLVLAFVGHDDSSRYRVEEVLPPDFLEDVPDMHQWDVRTTDSHGEPKQFSLGQLVPSEHVERKFETVFDPSHLLLKPGCILFADEPGAFREPKNDKDFDLMTRHATNILAALKPAGSRPSFLEAERRGADPWFTLRGGLFWQLSGRLINDARPRANHSRELDGTYRLVAFALASHACVLASDIRPSEYTAELLRLVRERVEFCEAIYHNRSRYPIDLTVGWALLASAGLAQRTAYAATRLFSAKTEPSFKKAAPAALREWRTRTSNRLDSLPQSTTRDPRFRRLVGRARNLLDSTNLDGQRRASLAIEVLEYFHQDEQARSAMPEPRS